MLIFFVSFYFLSITKSIMNWFNEKFNFVVEQSHSTNNEFSILKIINSQPLLCSQKTLLKRNKQKQFSNTIRKRMTESKLMCVTLFIYLTKTHNLQSSQDKVTRFSNTFLTVVMNSKNRNEAIQLLHYKKVKWNYTNCTNIFFNSSPYI